ncbi:MAG TPA: DUF6220 domain-containing protein [Candidatus Limnocylindrales bacterium]|nr:DUF6220 domain-containing protein [Candidatus Limnocylindrales bacterium]
MSSGRTVHLARLALVATAWLFVACLALQLFLVGLDVFDRIGGTSATQVGIHREFAYLYGWLAPLMVLLVMIGRLPRPRLVQAVLLLVLFAVQTYLPTLARDAPLLASVHSVNAIAVVWLAVSLALAARRELHTQPG